MSDFIFKFEKRCKQVTLTLFSFISVSHQLLQIKFFVSGVVLFFQIGCTFSNVLAQLSLVEEAGESGRWDLLVARFEQ